MGNIGSPLPYLCRSDALLLVRHSESPVRAPRQARAFDRLRKCDLSPLSGRNFVAGKTVICWGGSHAVWALALLVAARYAEFRIRPALESFYGTLTDAQKTQLAEEPQTVGSSETTHAWGRRNS